MEGLYYPYSEGKGADPLRGHRESAFLFSHMQNVCFLMALLILYLNFQ